MPKDIKYLSKRRQNQLLHRELEHNGHDFLQSTSSNVASNSTSNVEGTIYISENSEDSFCITNALYENQSRFRELSVEPPCSTENIDIELRHNNAAFTDILCNNEKTL